MQILVINKISQYICKLLEGKDIVLFTFVPPHSLTQGLLYMTLNKKLLDLTPFVKELESTT